MFVTIARDAHSRESCGSNVNFKKTSKNKFALCDNTGSVCDSQKKQPTRRSEHTAALLAFVRHRPSTNQLKNRHDEKSRRRMLARAHTHTHARAHAYAGNIPHMFSI